MKIRWMLFLEEGRRIICFNMSSIILSLKTTRNCRFSWCLEVNHLLNELVKCVCEVKLHIFFIRFRILWFTWHGTIGFLTSRLLAFQSCRSSVSLRRSLTDRSLFLVFQIFMNILFSIIIEAVIVFAFSLEKKMWNMLSMNPIWLDCESILCRIIWSNWFRSSSWNTFRDEMLSNDICLDLLLQIESGVWMISIILLNMSCSSFDRVIEDEARMAFLSLKMSKAMSILFWSAILV